VTEHLSTRALGRALLARQHLLERTARPAVDVVAHLVALQSQNPTSPYLALAARVAGFRHAELADALVDRRVGRLALLRDTVHLVTADDALALWPLLEPMLRRRTATATSAAATVRALDLDALARAARAALAGGPLGAGPLGERLAAAWPDLDPRGLALGARGLLPLVQVTPRGVWGASAATTWTTAEAWFGRPTADLSDPAVRDAALADLLRRYLAAYGPASVADAQRWSGLTRLGAVAERIADELVEVVPAGGGGRRRLLDLPDAPRPPEDAPAPVRLLPDFDDVLLGHDDRTRIVPAEVRPALATKNGQPSATVLVDGVVAGTWSLRREPLPRLAGAPRTRRDLARLRLVPLRTWTTAERAAVTAEAEAVVRFAADDAAEHAVTLTDAG
jgi:hypothetical protein